MARPYHSGQDVLRDEGIVPAARAAFLVRTYHHLFGAIAAFTLLEIFLFTSGLAETLVRGLLGVNWLLVLGGFVVVSWLASRAAHTAQSLAVQYLALGGFVVAESILFVPLLYVANSYAPGTISSAATITLLGVTGLTLGLSGRARIFRSWAPCCAGVCSLPWC